MRCIVVDLELNQPSRKIIEIGAVCFQPDTGTTVNTFQSFVCPNEDLNQEITTLTGIHKEELAFAPHIRTAAQKFSDFKKQHQANAIAITWGGAGSANNDASLIYKQAELENPFIPRIIDVKCVFQMLANASAADMRQKCGLKRACEVLKIGWDLQYGEPHRALADAHNTMRIYMFLSKCLKGGVGIKLG